MLNKRINLLAGHYGSGKTNIAINMVFALKKEYNKVAIADIDIVNPYFRTKDSSKILEKAEIKLICSPYAGTNVDVPALPAEIYAITHDKSYYAVMDIGGDDRGAFALGRYVPEIIAEDNYEMFFVINKYRPRTSNADDTIEIMREIEYACKLPFTGIINNSNLGNETTSDTVLNSLSYADEVAEKTALPLRFTAYHESLADDLKGKIQNPLVLTLQEKTI